VIFATRITAARAQLKERNVKKCIIMEHWHVRIVVLIHFSKKCDQILFIKFIAVANADL